MSSSSGASYDGFGGTTHKTNTPVSTKKRRKRIEIPIWELKSDDSNETREPVNKLTSLVRETYLAYLTKLLSENYKSCSTYDSKERIFSEKDIEQCAIQMEQKALRASIIARLYQRAMARMVADIKRNTEHLKVHSKLCNFSPQSCEKETQTESFSEEPSIGENVYQIDNDWHTALLPSFIDNNGNLNVDFDADNNYNFDSSISHEDTNYWPTRTKRAASKHASVNESVLIDVTITELNTHPLSSNLQEGCLVNKEELLFHSYSESDECPDNELNDDLVCQGRDEAVSKVCKQKPTPLQVSNNKHFQTDSKMQLGTRPAMTLDERLADLNFDHSSKFPLGEFSPENAHADGSPTELFFGEISAEDEQTTSRETKEFPELSALDERLAEIHGEVDELPGSKEAEKQKVDKPKKKLVWRYEELHHMKRLKLRLRSVNKTKRLKIEQRFIELFGNSADANIKTPKSMIAEDPLLEFKERIKPWVVKHLMPYYNSGKIESRPFFKHVAKHITDSLIEINHYPEESDVVETVQVLLNA